VSELPPGWVECVLSEIVSEGPHNGWSPKSGPDATGTLTLKLSATTAGRFVATEATTKRIYDVVPAHSNLWLEHGDILIQRANSLEHVGVVALFDGPSHTFIYPDLMMRIRVKDPTIARYLVRWLSHDRPRRHLRENATGTAGNMPKISGAILNATPVVLAPLAEQKRIADKLDALLSRVDACRERLDRVPAILKRFRQSVLAAATSGELTREWREANDPGPSAQEVLLHIASDRERRGLSSARRAIEIEGIDEPDVSLPESWRWCRVGQVADVRIGGTPARSETKYWNGDIPWVSSGEVANSRITKTTERITRLGIENSSAKVYPRGTVLIAMIGEGKTRGQSALLEIDATTNQNVAGLVFESDLINPEYVWYWALGEYERTRSVGRGGNQPALNGAKVRALAFPLAPPSEQQVIAERVRGLLRLADEAEQRLKTALRVVGRLTPSALAKAFRGELVPQDPNDEPASELLARLRGPTAPPAAATEPKAGASRTRRAKPKTAVR
jgi:type I restriction enzyme S subunit